MARIARIVVPGYPHHITQRGNRRQETFFCDDDYKQYIALMAEWCSRCGVTIWAYCLMPNHTHLIAVPRTEEGMRKAIGEAHRRYARMINFREGWRGYLWQGRFSSFVMDERYLLAAVRYIGNRGSGFPYWRYWENKEGRTETGDGKNRRREKGDGRWDYR